MKKFILNLVEKDELSWFLNTLIEKYGCFDQHEFATEAGLLAQHLPYRLRKFINEYKNSANTEERGCIISQFPVGDIKNTPISINDKLTKLTSRKEEMLAILIGSLLGEVFGWKNEQMGNLVHDIIPVPEDQNKQVSTGANQVIHWHTEEAFHPFSPDYLGLFCLRNHQNVHTHYLCINSIDLNDNVFDILFEPKYVFKTVESHSTYNTNSSFKKSILFGNRKKPFIRIDPYFMEDIIDDIKSKKAFNLLISKIKQAMKKVVLHAGDFLLLDNLQCVHGREALKANYDGADRWLKRINVTRDLYKSRNALNPVLSRILV
jgi:Fe(II)/alpha-ketoglutarate-dependent arginine beta-hydroxylase